MIEIRCSRCGHTVPYKYKNFIDVKGEPVCISCFNKTPRDIRQESFNQILKYIKTLATKDLSFENFQKIKNKIIRVLSIYEGIYNEKNRYYW